MHIPQKLILTLSQKANYILIYGFIIAAFIPMFHYNITLQYISPQNEDQALKFPTDKNMQFYQKIISPAKEIGDRIGLNTTWKMYSSGRRNTIWVDWYIKDEKGNLVLLQTPNQSADYRSKRPILSALFFDFKLAILQMNLNNRPYFRNSYANYLCQKTSQELGHTPYALQPKLNEKIKRPPQESKNWSLLNSPPDKEFYFEPYSCQKSEIIYETWTN